MNEHTIDPTDPTFKRSPSGRAGRPRGGAIRGLAERVQARARKRSPPSGGAAQGGAQARTMAERGGWSVVGPRLRARAAAASVPDARAALLDCRPAGVGLSTIDTERPKPPARGRPFAPGTSGNPRGRPPGARNKATVIAQSLLDGDAQELVSRAIQLAKGGDGVALRLCIERLVPRKGHYADSAVIDLPTVRQAEDLASAAAAVIAAAAAGELRLDEARAWMQLLQSQRQLIETVDLAVRLEVLESARVSQKGGRKDRRL